MRSEDSALLHFRMAGGAIGSAVLSEVSHGRTNRLTLEITGQNRSVWWDSEASTALHGASKGSGVRTALYPFGFNGFTDTFITLAGRYYAALGWTTPAEREISPPSRTGRIWRICAGRWSAAPGKTASGRTCKEESTWTTFRRSSRFWT